MEKLEATLTIVMQINILNNWEGLKSDIETLSEYGHVIKAELVIPAGTKIDLKP